VTASSLVDLVNKIHCSDVMAFTKQLPDESIHVIMTSPPYWGLRDYGSSTEAIWCGAWRGQLGLEPHPSLYIQHLVAVCRELRRVLRKDGSMYLVLGDTYYGSVTGRSKSDLGSSSEQLTNKGFFSCDDAKGLVHREPLSNWLTPKQKLMIPARVAIALQEDGWILRNEITWYKSNAMPESVRDRLTEKTERIYHFVKNRKYYFDLDAIRQPHQYDGRKQTKYLGGPHDKSIGPHERWPKPLGKNPGDVYKSESGQYAIGGRHSGYFNEDGFHPDGANPGDFWSINTKPFKDAHFAVFPEDLCVMPIKAACPPDGIVLDPFCGSGTTCLVAAKLNRRWIGVDINRDYCEMARNRLADFMVKLDEFG